MQKIIEDAVSRLDFMVCHNADNNFWKDGRVHWNIIIPYLEAIVPAYLENERVEYYLEKIEAYLIGLDNDEDWIEDEDAYCFSEFMDRLWDIWDVITLEKA